jgi:hypothetical protein
LSMEDAPTVDGLTVKALVDAVSPSSTPSLTGAFESSSAGAES